MRATAVLLGEASPLRVRFGASLWNHRHTSLLRVLLPCEPGSSIALRAPYGQFLSRSTSAARTPAFPSDTSVNVERRVKFPESGVRQHPATDRRLDEPEVRVRVALDQHWSVFGDGDDQSTRAVGVRRRPHGSQRAPKCGNSKPSNRKPVSGRTAKASPPNLKKPPPLGEETARGLVDANEDAAPACVVHVASADAYTQERRADDRSTAVATGAGEHAQDVHGVRVDGGERRMLRQCLLEEKAPPT